MKYFFKFGFGMEQEAFIGKWQLIWFVYPKVWFLQAEPSQTETSRVEPFTFWSEFIDINAITKMFNGKSLILNFSDWRCFNLKSSDQQNVCWMKIKHEDEFKNMKNSTLSSVLIIFDVQQHKNTFFCLFHWFILSPIAQQLILWYFHSFPFFRYKTELIQTCTFPNKNELTILS